jgi:heptosyltransferase-2
MRPDSMLSSEQKKFSSPRILFINLGGLGDVLMTTPALRDLKEKFPRAYTVAAILDGRGAEEVLNTNPFIDELFIYNPEKFRGIGKIRLLRWVKEKKFDIAITRFPAGINIFDILSFFCRIPRRIKHISVRNKMGNFFHNVLIASNPEYHRQDCNRQLVHSLETIMSSPSGRKRMHLNVNVPPARFPAEINFAAEDIRFKENFFQIHGITKGDILIALHFGCFSNAYLKKWPGERFAVLADKLFNRYKNRTIIFATSEEEQELNSIIGAVSAPVIKAVDFPLRKAAAILNGCNLLVSNDSGLMHVSEALGMPLIALFGPTSPLKVGPLNHNSVVLKTTRKLSCPGIKDGDFCCVYLHKNNCPHTKEGIVECLYYLDVEDVLDAVDNVIRTGRK